MSKNVGKTRGYMLDFNGGSTQKHYFWRVQDGRELWRGVAWCANGLGGSRGKTYNIGGSEQWRIQNRRLEDPKIESLKHEVQNSETWWLGGLNLRLEDQRTCS